MGSDAVRAELRSRLERLSAEEDALRARRLLLTYKLEQCVCERDRLKRHLEAASSRRELLGAQENDSRNRC